MAAIRFCIVMLFLAVIFFSGCESKSDTKPKASGTPMDTAKASGMFEEDSPNTTASTAKK
jgi:hypothetical protein